MNQLRQLYRVEGLPVFQNKMFPSREAALASAQGDMTLVQNMHTGLVYNASFQPELLKYDADYQNEQAVSKVFQEHLESVSALIEKHFSKQSLIEVGCGKGHFLEHLQSLGFAISGFDPTYEGSNPAVTKDFFSPALGLRGDAIVLRHVLEHVQDPVAFLSGLLVSNGGQGKIYIEVPCLDWICDQRAWFDIFYEHVNYFRLSDFDRLFGTVYQSGHTFGGQYLYVVADLATLQQPLYHPASYADFPEHFTDSVEGYAGRAKSGNCAIWGGASKGVIFALQMQRAGAGPMAVFDINPAKQGKYLAVTGIQVQPPEVAQQILSPGADLFVMNRNYLSEIQELTHNRYHYVLV